jgi:hypothetical protein
VVQESDYGVFFEFVNPQTGFIMVSGLSEADARLTAQRQMGQQPGFRILGVWPITEKLTYVKPKTQQGSQLALPQPANRS